MKPETVARRERERAQATKDRRRVLLARLAEKAQTEGSDSIWAEMLAEQLAR